MAAIFEVFGQVSTWIVESVSDLMPMFYADNQLTFLGMLSVAGLGISVVLMLIGLIQSFLRFN